MSIFTSVKGPVLLPLLLLPLLLPSPHLRPLVPLPKRPHPRPVLLLQLLRPVLVTLTQGTRFVISLRKPCLD